MKKRDKKIKIMAWIALFWILISMIWTWLIVILSWWTNNSQEISWNDLVKLQNLINTQTWSLNNSTWSIIEDTSTWIIYSSGEISWSWNIE
jgi:hypothetical protein